MHINTNIFEYIFFIINYKIKLFRNYHLLKWK